MRQGEGLCFVFGVPRSGTSWVTSLISEHPHARRVVPRMLGYETLDGGFETGVFLRKYHRTEIVERFLAIPGDKLLVEKTIDHAFKVDVIARVFPRALRVLVRRDPVDVVWSMMKSTWPVGMFPKPFEDAVEFYRVYRTALYPRSDWSLVVSYQDMVKTGVQGLLGLWRGVGLDTEGHWARDVFARCDRGKSYPAGMVGLFRNGRIGDGHRGLTEQQVRYVDERVGG